MIDHVTISVNDLAKSRAFYEKAFIPFEYKVLFGEDGKFWAFDIGMERFSKLLNIKKQPR